MENVTAAQVKDALERVIASFQTVLYEDDEQFLENMKTKNLEGDDIRRYQHWEWTQGVGLYGFWRLFEATKSIRKMMSIWESVTSGLRALCTIFCAQRKAVFSTKPLIP